MIQIIDKHGNLIYMSNKENIDIWLEGHPEIHNEIRIYVPGLKELITVWEYQINY